MFLKGQIYPLDWLLWSIKCVCTIFVCLGTLLTCLKDQFKLVEVSTKEKNCAEIEFGIKFIIWLSIKIKLIWKLWIKVYVPPTVIFRSIIKFIIDKFFKVLKIVRLNQQVIYWIFQVRQIIIVNLKTTQLNFLTSFQIQKFWIVCPKSNQIHESLI